jgi:transcriptional regulator with XRE-family HTH domain
MSATPEIVGVRWRRKAVAVTGHPAGGASPWGRQPWHPSLARADFTAQLGEQLRTARLRMGWSLTQAAAASNGQYAAVVIGSYERGERHVSIQALAELADLYGLTATTLLPADDTTTVEQDLHELGPVTVLVHELHQLPLHLARPIARYVTTVLAARHTLHAEQVTIRTSDLFVLAAVTDTTPAGLLAQLDHFGVLHHPGTRRTVTDGDSV